MYNEIISARFQNLKNAGMVTNADAVGQVGDVASGDIIKIYLRVVDGIITDAKFKTFGSVYGLVASDVVCDMLKKCSLEDAATIKGEEIVKALGGLPDNKMHIPNLMHDVIANAIEDYHKKQLRAQQKAANKK